ncbi:putative anti-sigmaE protein [Rhabdaerophilaceae bacterium]
MTQHDAQTLDLIAGSFVLGTLESSEREEAETMFANRPDFQRMVLSWQAKFAPLDANVALVQPKPELWTRIDAALPPQAGAQRSALASSGRAWWHAIWESLDFWRPAGLAGALASLVLAFGLAVLVNRPAPGPALVAVLNAGDGRAVAIVNAYANGEVELIPLDRIDVPDGRIIEVWTLQSREQGPVSIGRMDQAKRLKLNLDQLGKPDVNHLFELTLEPAGGSPTGKPTGPILMKGLAAKAI